mgnify:CR=1 FL=1|tara:strand:- start:3749 stop:9577 length:5829 start_codon:yes stop_codon:yes gene_type:complete
MSESSINATDRRRYAPQNDSLNYSSRGFTEQTIAISDVISEGPIAGLVNGGSSIFLNNDSLEAEAQTVYSAPAGATVALTSGSTTATVDSQGNSFNVQSAVDGKKYLQIFDAYTMSVTAAGVEYHGGQGSGGGFVPDMPRGGSTVITRTAGASFTSAMNTTAGSSPYVATQETITNGGVRGNLTIKSRNYELSGNFSNVNTSNQTATFTFVNTAGWALMGAVGDNEGFGGTTVHTLTIDLYLEISAINGTTITLASAPPSDLFSGSPRTFSFGITRPITTHSAAPDYGSNTQADTEKYEGAGFTFNPGDVFQPALPGLGGVGVSSVPISFPSGALEKNNAKVITASGSQAALIDEVKILVTYPNGLYTQDGGKDKKWPSGAAYHIELAINRGSGDVYETVRGNGSKGGLSCFTHGGTYTSATTFEFRINLEQYQPFQAFKIRITRKTMHAFNDGHVQWPSLNEVFGGKHKIVGTSQIAGVQGLIKEKLNYPYTAMANVSFSSKSFQSVPSRTYECQGLKIKVPSNYVTRQENDGLNAQYNRNVSTGALVVDGSNNPLPQFWDGNFRDIDVFTDNPAWIFYDILTNNRYGLGEFLRSTDIDKFSLYKIARYCDELVPDGKGGQEPRFTANLYLTKATDAFKVMKDIATIFRGILYWSDSKFFAVIDEKREPIYTFSKANVIDGQFKYESTGDKTRANQIIVTWNNPESDYKLEPLLVEDRENQIKTGKIVSSKAMAYGCTSQGQAVRYGRWKLWTAINQTEVLSFETSINAGFLSPGDIVNIHDEADFRMPFSGRIRSCTNSEITIDRSVASDFANGFNYTIAVIIPKRTILLNQDRAVVKTSSGDVTLTRGDEVTEAQTEKSGSAVTLLNASQDTTDKNIVSALDTSGNSIELQYAESQIVEERTLTTGSATTNDGVDTIPISSAFSETPAVGAIWAIKETSTSTAVITESSYKQFKIMTIDETSKGKYGIVAVQYEPGKFDVLENDFTLDTPDPLYSPEGVSDVPAPKNIRILRMSSAGKDGEELALAWDPPDPVGSSGVSSNYEHLSYFEVTHNCTSSTGRPPTFTVPAERTSVGFNNVPDGLFAVFQIRTVSAKGRKSEAAVAKIQVEDIFSGNFPRTGGIIRGGFSSNDVMMIDSGSEKGTVKFTNTSFVAAPFTDIELGKRNTEADANTYSISTAPLANAQWPQQNSTGGSDLGWIFMDFSKLDASNPNADALKLIQLKQAGDSEYGVEYWYDGTKFIADSDSIWTGVGNVAVTQGERKVTGSGFNSSLKIPDTVRIGTFGAKVAYVESDTVAYLTHAYTGSTSASIAMHTQELDIDYDTDFLVCAVHYTASENDSAGQSGKYRISGNGMTFLEITPDLNAIGRSVVVNSPVPFLQYQADNTQVTTYANIQLTMAAVNFDEAEFKVTGSGFSQVNQSQEGVFTTGTNNSRTVTVHNSSSAITYSATPIDFTVTAREKSDPDNTSKQVTSTFSIGKIREGIQGNSTALVYLYKNSEDDPGSVGNSFPTVTVALSGTGAGTITGVSSGVISGAGQIGSTGWFKTPQTPNTNEKIWVVAATANGLGTTDTILNTEWTSPVQFSGADGNPGPGGFSSATVEIFKLSTVGTGSTTTPNQALTYKFSDGTLKNSSGVAQNTAGNVTGFNGWRTVAPNPDSTNKYLYKRTAAAIATTLATPANTTASIATNDWSDAILIAQLVEGGPGAPGKLSITGTLYYQTGVVAVGGSFTPPSVPSGSINFRFSDNKFQEGGSFLDTVDGWALKTPTFAPFNASDVAQKWYACTFSAEENESEGDIASGSNLTFVNVTEVHSFDGVVAFTDLENAGGSTVIQGEYINTGQIKRGSPEASEIDGTNFVGNGEFVINLLDGTINTPKFKVKGSTGDAEFKGSVKGGSFEGTNSLLTNAGDKITVGNNVTIDGQNQQIKITDASGNTRVVLGKL